MTLVGLDLNATRTLGVSGPEQVAPRPLPLEGARLDLPTAVSLQGRYPEAGRTALTLCRLLPHLVCTDFLAHLGESRQWVAGPHRLDADRALTLVFERLPPALAGAKGLAM